MVKQLLTLAAVAALALPVSAETVTLWESTSPDGDLVSWNQIEGSVVSAEDCAIVTAGGEFLVTVVKFDKALSEWPQVIIKDGWWGDLTGSVLVGNLEMPAVVSFGVTPAMAETVHEKGVFVSGDACWISKLEYKTSDVVVDPDAVWVGNAEFTGWSVNVSIPAATFDGIKVGDQLIFDVKAIDDAEDVNFKFLAGDWDGGIEHATWKDLKIVDGSVTYEVDAADVENIAAKGIIIQGTNITLSQVILKTSTSGINSAINNTVATYYNMQGMQVVNPAKGQVYIVKRGNKVAKEIIR